MVVDTTPPTSTVSFPTSGTYYNNAGWSAGCNTSPFNVTNSICGTATDPGTYPSGVASVAVSVQSTSGATSGMFWGGSSFNQSSEDQLPAIYSGGDWTLSFPSGNFPADGGYTVRVYATDNDGNVQSPGTAGVVQHRQHRTNGQRAFGDSERPVRLEPDVLRQRAGDADGSRHRRGIGRSLGVVLLLRRFERELHEQHAVGLDRLVYDVERQLRCHLEHTTSGGRSLPDRCDRHGQCR